MRLWGVVPGVVALAGGCKSSENPSARERWDRLVPADLCEAAGCQLEACKVAPEHERRTCKLRSFDRLNRSSVSTLRTAGREVLEALLFAEDQARRLAVRD